MLKYLLILSTALSFVPSAHAERIGETRYVAGGVTGTVFGLGLGHAIQGRWISDDGYLFTLVEAATAAAVLTAKSTTTCTGTFPTLSCNQTYPDYVNGAAIVFLAVRIYEIFDIWSTSSHMSVGLIPQPENPKLFFAFRF